MKKYIYLIIISVLIQLIVGCAKVEGQSLKIGVMPAVDTAPIFLAEKNGYFEELGLEVEIQIFTNAQNRQTALQTNEIDGAMTDLVALITNNAAGFELVGTLSTDGMFPLLVHPEYVDDIDIKVGMMEVSVSNYLVEKYLGGVYNFEKIYINAIPTRMEAVGAGKIQRGLIPEPLASIGEMNGLIKVVYEGLPAESLDLMAFTRKAVDAKSNSIELFHQAYAKAVIEIQDDPSIARDILMESITNLPPAIKETMTLPIYTEPSLPSDEFVNDLIEWTSKILDKTLDVTVDDILDRKFVN